MITKLHFMSLDSISLTEEVFYGLALGLIPGIGHIHAKTLLSYSGSFSGIFKAKPSTLVRIPGMGPELVRRITGFTYWDLIDKEIRYMERQGIRPLFYNESDFPQRLLHFNDSPFLLFCKGNAGLNTAKTIGMVGTRAPSQAGIKWTNQLIGALKDSHITVVSGFAYGIDITAHKACIREGIPTIGVLAGGFRNIYPSLHLRYVDQMCENGGLITEAYSDILPEKQRFPMRNRIIAALSDGLIVVESAEKGGSIITAEYGFNYNKTVMAVPGKPADLLSRGCNALIKAQKAAMIEDYTDMLKEMNWDDDGRPRKKALQIELFRSLSDKEQALINFLIRNGETHIDTLIHQLNMRNSELASMILSLTLEGMITQLPGSRITLS